ncbi:MAG: phosphogluconate dehydratase, partial [Pseudomonadales bacterium]
MNPVVEAVTQELVERSAATRQTYLDRMRYSMEQTPPKRKLSCGNLAHAFAANSDAEKTTIADQVYAPSIASDRLNSTNLGIVTSYNDMLSAHQPLKDYPDKIKEAALALGSTAQVAGGVPAMCDGVTQGHEGMELSLFSRDVIALATAISLSHNMFDGNLFLGVCDKIVPGMMIGALEFGHLPAVFVPAGPMPTGMSNDEKAKQRQLFAEGKIDRRQMLEVESACYHSPGTCTFYGTANSNQMLMEMLGVQLAGASFVQPGTELRTALTKAAVEKLVRATEPNGNYRPLYDVITEKSIINALVGLLATGGSTNHSLHLVAIARCAGIMLDWSDIDRLSQAVPLLAKVYPNGSADVNHFQQAGGMAFLVHELRRAELLNEDVVNIMGADLSAYEMAPELKNGELVWQSPVTSSTDTSVLASIDAPFASNGGLSLLKGNLGKSIIKVSAVKEEHRKIEAPAAVFESQNKFIDAFNRGELFRDMVAVVRFQGPAANGMPELHKLTPLLGICQDRGYKVALVTDGRMSGASGKVPAAIH